MCGVVLWGCGVGLCCGVVLWDRGVEECGKQRCAGLVLRGQ